MEILFGFAVFAEVLLGMFFAHNIDEVNNHC